MDISPLYTEQFIEFLENAIAYGQPWIVYQAPHGKIEERDWNSYETAEEAKLLSDGDRLAHIDQLFPKVQQRWQEQIVFREQLNWFGQQIDQLGFGELREELAIQLASGKDNFTLTTKQNDLDYQLVFERLPHDPRLNFPYYIVKDQYFRNHDGKGFTAREAFNMLEGRAVFKHHADRQGMTYTAWNVLSDRKILQFTGAGRFDISDLPIPDPNILKALHQGDKVEIKRYDQTCYLQVDPLRRQIDITGSDGKPVRHVQKSEPLTHASNRKLKR